MVFVDVVKADAFIVVCNVNVVVFNLLLVDTDCCVVLLEFCAAETLLKFNMRVKPNKKSSINSNYCLILMAPKVLVITFNDLIQ